MYYLLISMFIKIEVRLYKLAYNMLIIVEAFKLK